jgi:hypothetical protein
VGGPASGAEELAAPAPAAAGAPASIRPDFMRRKIKAPMIAAAPIIEPTAAPALAPGERPFELLSRYVGFTVVVAVHRAVMLGPPWMEE